MKSLLILLSFLFIIGILWLRSNFTAFKEEIYLTPEAVQESKSIPIEIDFEYLKKEFKPAYEY